MKDSYSFDVDHDGLNRSYSLHHGLYCRILERCGLKFVAVEASSGAMGGSQSEEFMVRTEAGEDSVVSCACGYAANLERAVSRIAGIADEPASGPTREVPTPGQKTIAEIAAFLKVPPTHQIKSLVYMVGDKPYLFLVRGDHQLNDAKAMAFTRTVLVRPARPDEIRDCLELMRAAWARSESARCRLSRTGSFKPAEHDLWRQQRRLPLAGGDAGGPF